MSGHHLPPTEEEDDFGLPPVTLDTLFPTWISLDGLPKVSKDKLEKLSTVVRKVLGSIGEVRDFIMPFDEAANTTKGFAFVEYHKADAATTAVGKLHGYALDKVHTFKVAKMSDLDLLEKLSDDYQAPDIATEPPSSDHLYEYLLNHYAQDQYLCFNDVCTEIFLNGVAGDKARGLHRKTEWTEKYFQWSPNGTYLITLHHAGVFLWGGADFKRLKKFPHVGVDLVDISPCENYLITTSQKPMDGNNEEAIIIWDIRSGQKLRGFPRLSPHWPAFRWSHDDKYFARLHQGLISVYETPSMKLLENKSVKLHGPIQDFVWSPSQNVFAAWVPEANNVPARVVLLRMPDRKELAQKNLFNVVDCKLHWQPQGDFLCVKVDRVKAKKQNTTFELFRIREKDIPVEALELDDFVLAFAWEPRGQRFAIVHAEVANAPRPNVSFYTMAGKKVKHSATLEKRPCNALFWSPMGRFIMLAGFRNHNGALEFYDAQENITMGTGEHPLLTNVEWDPTGRYVATVVSFWTEKLENGFKIWSFTGKNISADVKAKMYQFLWRPRPPTLLTKDQEKLIQKNFKEYSERYKKEDEEKIQIQREEKRRRKEMQRVEIDRIMAMRTEEWEKEREKRRQIRGYDSDDEDVYETVEEIIEEVVEVQEEVVDE